MPDQRTIPIVGLFRDAVRGTVRRLSSVSRGEKTTSTRSRRLQSTARGVMKRAGATPVCGRSSRHKPASLVSSLRGSLPPVREVRSIHVLHAKQHPFLKRLDKENPQWQDHHDLQTRQTTRVKSPLKAALVGQPLTQLVTRGSGERRGAASFQRAKKSWHLMRPLVVSPWSA